MALLINFLSKQSDQATTASSTGNAPQVMPDEELTICHQKRQQKATNGTMHERHDGTNGTLLVWQMWDQ